MRRSSATSASPKPLAASHGKKRSEIRDQTCASLPSFTAAASSLRVPSHCYDAPVNPSNSFTSRPIVRIRESTRAAADDQLAVEEPLEIRIGKEPLAITMRTPGHDADLAAGFCLTEGIIQHADEIESIEPCRIAEYGNIVIVRLTEEAAARRQSQITCAKRELYISSSCGLCGKQSIDRIQRTIKPIQGDFKVSPALLTSLPALMRQTQPTFEATGGLHAAALFNTAGHLQLLREDVGRHNAVDKVIGAALLTGQLPLSSSLLLVSGRASFELIQKAALASIPLLAAIGAPSSLAVDLATRLNITLIGFLRDERMNIYSGEHRIL